LGPAGSESIFDERDNADQQWSLAGTVLSAHPEHGILISCKQTFTQTDELELVPFMGPAVQVPLSAMKSPDFVLLQKTRPSTLLRLPFTEGVAVNQVLRVRKGALVCAP